MGVRRAVEIAEKEAARNRSLSGGSRVYTLGPLIHNQKALADLDSQGVKIIDDLPAFKSSLSVSDYSSATVIIRTHGVCPGAEEELRGMGCRVVDATCPKVKQSQLKVRELASRGFYLFLAGEEKHAEITGLLGFASRGYAEFTSSGVNDDQSHIKDNKFSEVVGSAEEALSAALSLCNVNKNAKTALIGQTTIGEDQYNDIANAIKKYFPSLMVINSICAATKERQNALRELLPLSDALIVAGGNESANTRCLYSIAKENGKPCVLARNSLDIPPDFFSYENIGLCAGASTPDSVINEIESSLTREGFLE